MDCADGRGGEKVGLEVGAEVQGAGEVHGEGVRRRVPLAGSLQKI
jgi:hypothetical protein